MKNIDRFNLYAGKILSELYTNFPMPKDLDCLKITTGNSVVDKYGQGFSHENLQEVAENSEVKFAIHTINWLESAGYFTIVRKSNLNIIFYECVLTTKALEVLNAVPESLESSLGAELTDAVKEVSKDATSATIANLVGQFFSGVLKATISP